MATSRPLFEKALDFRAQEAHVTAEPDRGKFVQVAVNPTLRDAQGLRYFFGIQEHILRARAEAEIWNSRGIFHWELQLRDSNGMGKGGMGMDAGIGLLHVDAPSRDSLVLDIREPIRPKCDTFVLHWLQSEPLRKADFWEDRNGNCRLCSPLASKLYETADTWRRMLAPVAEFVAQELWFSRAPKCERRVLATRHTQRNKRIAKNSEVPIVNQLRPEHACEECGVKIPTDKKLCFKCWKKATPANFVKGRKLPHTPKSLARRAETQRKQRALNRAFDPATLPEWLTREFYVKQVIPALSNVPKRRIRRMLAVSEPHAARIAKGIVPHPRHWQALAQLVGLSC